MLRIVLVDDEREFLIMMKELLQNWLARRGESYCIDIFQHAEVFYMEYKEGRKYDICFLDIEMPQMNGCDLAMKIRERDEAVILVFLTSHREFIKVGYKISAFDYVAKEEIRNELPDLMERLLRKIEREASKYYIITTYCRYEKIAYADIIFIYKQDQNVRFVLKNGEMQERNSLKNILVELDRDIFILVERGYIVNISHITRLKARELILSNGRILMVSKEHIMKIRERLGMYCMNKLSDVKE